MIIEVISIFSIILLGMFLTKSILGLYSISSFITQHLITIAQCLSVLFVSLFIFKYNRSNISFVFEKPKYKDVFWGVGLAIICFLFATIMYSILFPQGVEKQEVTTANNILDYIVLFLSSFIFAYYEEYLFRAYFLNIFKKIIRVKWLAFTFTIALYTIYYLITGTSFHMIPIVFYFGLFYTITYMAIKRLWPIVICHAVIHFSVFAI